jgi:predicted transcriptional regulator
MEGGRKMINSIGENAGKVWKYLDKHGEVSTASLVKGTKLSQREADRAIGWLAREGKIHIRKEAKKEIISLTK